MLLVKSRDLSQDKDAKMSGVRYEKFGRTKNDWDEKCDSNVGDFKLSRNLQSGRYVKRLTKVLL